MGLFFNDTAAGNLNSPSNIGYSTSNTYTPSSSVAQGTNTLMVPQLNLANPFPTFQRQQETAEATGNSASNRTWDRHPLSTTRSSTRPLNSTLRLVLNAN